ncbi:hypothetical protein [Rothia uropygialis]|uniref:hypothetical protein n=1 Tax=Kocuria sp. 36 TaxID=1415402 RepID=UPI00101CB44D|nr:hypothetical protein [Kocuria sp. 36]
MSDDFFQYAESQMGGTANDVVVTPYTCWAVSGECPTVTQAMSEATNLLHSVVSQNAMTHSREAAARGNSVENRWLSTDHEITRIEGTERYPTTYIVSMVATLEVHHSGPDEEAEMGLE